MRSCSRREALVKTRSSASWRRRRSGTAPDLAIESQGVFGLVQQVGERDHQRGRHTFKLERPAIGLSGSRSPVGASRHRSPSIATRCTDTPARRSTPNTGCLPPPPRDPSAQAPLPDRTPYCRALLLRKSLTIRPDDQDTDSCPSRRPAPSSLPPPSCSQPGRATEPVVERQTPYPDPFAKAPTVVTQKLSGCTHTGLPGTHRF